MEPAADINALHQRFTWKYSFASATEEPAKTNVSSLRRRAAEQDEEARLLFRPRRAKRAGLSAADIGLVHHVFLQHVACERAGSPMDLRSEAERLVTERRLNRDEANALDFDALLRFWQSSIGQTIRAQAQWVHRELPFTARFALRTLQELGLTSASTTTHGDEFVVVQGVVDLAIIRPDSISILDFKTDTFHRADLEVKMREYAPQLRLYGFALSRIYRRPVADLSLYFLALGEHLPISAN